MGEREDKKDEGNEILSYNNRKPNEKIKEIFIPNGPRLQSILNKTATKNKEKNTFPLPVCSQ